MTEPVTITICGTPSRETLTALFDLAVSAGLGLALQPRQVVAAPLQLPPAAVRRIESPRKPKPIAKAKRVKANKAPAAPAKARTYPVQVQGVTGRAYAAKDCATCSKPFIPSGPNSKTCTRCRAEFKANVQPTRGDELETVWNGEAGRNGRGLSSH